MGLNTGFTVNISNQMQTFKLKILLNQVTFFTTSESSTKQFKEQLLLAPNRFHKLKDTSHLKK